MPSPCDICNKVFNSNKYLKHHKRTVHTENTFNCKECPKKFSDTANLRKHFKKTHDIEFVECSVCKDKICEICAYDNLLQLARLLFINTRSNSII